MNFDFAFKTKHLYTRFRESGMNPLPSMIDPMKSSFSALLFTFSILLFCQPGFSQQADDKEAVQKKLQELADKLQYQKGTVSIKGGLATLKLNDKFQYLSPADSHTLLEKLWGNPHGADTLGTLVPVNFDPLAEDSWAIVITYEEDGYVSDKDADSINYDKLLKEMKEGTAEGSKERVKQGYRSIELVGWAAPPRYDKAAHKLYWAKELKFGDSADHTLNYDIRVLGRRGVLNLNAIAGMNQLAMIEENAPEVLSFVDFNDGHRYTDFNASSDKVATYGIAALVAGGIAAKVGLFKWLWITIIAFKKLVIVAIAGIGSFFAKIFKKNRTT
jgi:uncharacterized membrane-anchored protein